ncbi:hypothetical protein [Salinadaptatus halalkaliphilus]|nr:hypothetical protein [Salinadaptatus halalkaliphilus]
MVEESVSDHQTETGDESPTRWELLVAAVTSLWAVWILATADTVVWSWVLAGFVVFAVGIGLGASSPVGQRFGAWFRAIGVVGRGAVVVLVATVIWGVLAGSVLPVAATAGFGAGGLLGIGAVVVATLLR